MLAYLTMLCRVGHIWDCQLLTAKVKVPSSYEITFHILAHISTTEAL